ncbi:hypothetical protein BPMI_02141c [Candidatus Burkholderia pumila]|uniref:Uncharacterized protein n=1 Tax=Candidatus Burkholderia pumila TaxID=1090375 RepID=A0ABR5HP09_9BURK|nr:hypothetical protein BPMI_02141c [Candidatus Burkholderia pumila]
MKKLSAASTPRESYLAVRFALAETINGGITSVMNWAHNIRSPQHADAELRAMFESGAGGRFLYGYPQDMESSKTNNFAYTTRVRQQYFSSSDGAIDLGMAIRGPERTPAPTWQREIGFARQHELPGRHTSRSHAKCRSNALLSRFGWLAGSTAVPNWFTSRTPATTTIARSSRRVHMWSLRRSRRCASGTA